MRSRNRSGISPESLNSASLGWYRRLHRRTKDAQQSLREHTIERRHKVVWLDAHVEETADDVDHVVRVNRREYQVAGERRVDRNLSGFIVSNLADHDLVRVVAQDASQTSRKREPLLLVHLDLRHASQLILDRVFDRDDLVLVVPNLVQRSVERSRFSRTRRAGHEHHAVRLENEPAESGEQVRIEPDNFKLQVLEAFVDLLLVENSDDRVFPVNRRHDRHTKIDACAL